MTIRAVLLDVGGVFHLPDPARVHAALATIGLEVDGALLARAHYAGVAAIMPAPWVGGSDSGAGTPADAEPRLAGADAGEDTIVWDAYHRGYLNALDVAETEHGAAVAAMAAGSTFAGMWTYGIPGSREALVELATLDVKIAVVSNADGSVEQRLGAEGILQVGPGPGVEVAAVIDSGAVGCAKPDPRIFVMALDILGVDAADAIHVGDMPAFDVAGAQAAGVRPVLVDPYDDHPHADVTRVRSLADVVELVRTENALWRSES